MNILITGAAGLIGGALSERLVARGHRLTAVVHRNTDVRANDGTRVAKIATIAGDIGVPWFGWDGRTAARVAREHHLLVHCAATVRFGLPAEDYARLNVGGTKHAIDIALAGSLPLLHVSTAYVCGARDSTILETDPIPSSGFANSYETSKARAEALVAASGLRFAIARPSIVVGDSATGAIRSFDAIYTIFRLMAEGRMRHLPARATAMLDFVPIDHVAAGLADLVERIDVAGGGCFHLVSGQAIAIADVVAAIGAYPRFKVPMLVDPAAFAPSMLAPTERRLFRRVAHLYGAYLQRNPRFDDRRFRALTGRVCPPTGAAYLHRLIGYCIRAGFLQGAATASGHADNATPNVSARRMPT